MRILLSIFLLLLPLSCFSQTSVNGELNFLSWASYISPEIIEKFEQETGIKVNVDYVDSHYSLEAKIIAANHGYDVTVPTLAPFFLRQVQFGLFQPLDYSNLKNYKYIDPRIVTFEKLAENSDKHAIPFMLDTIGLGYDYKKITSILPTAPLNSLRMIFDPEVVKHFSTCEIEMLDSPEEIVGLALIYLGLNPNSESEEDLQKAFEVLRKIRPYIGSINSALYFNNLASGDNCMVIGYSGDIVHARQMSLNSGNNLDIKYILPIEGSVMILDLMAISASSKNQANAYKFLDYIMRPDVNASIANAIGFTSPNLASYSLIRKEFKDNPNIYPLEHNRNNLYTLKIPTPSYNRLRNRMWMKFVSDEWGD
jgi:putrescine transport system substrate-binding protein